MNKLTKQLKELQARGYESILISQVLEWIRFYSWEAKVKKIEAAEEVDKLIDENTNSL